MKKHLKIVVSDCHLGTGATLPNGGINPMEDFRKDDKFVEFLEHYSVGANAETNVELIINGDFFDMLQTRSKMTSMPYEILETIAVYKIRRILRGHPKVVRALKKFIDTPDKRVMMIWGNHDAGLWWPNVQREIKKALGEKLEIRLEPYAFDGVRIEHGHQYEVLNHFDLDHMFIERRGRKFLNYPFGSFFVGGFLAKLKLKRNYITQVVPFNKFLRWALIFDFWFAVRQGIHAVWFFFKMRFIFHPLRFTRFSKTIQIVAELFRRPDFSKLAPDILKAHNAQILLMGHDHRPTHRYYPDGTQYINTGTWTDIISFETGSLGRNSRPCYGYIEYPEGAIPGQGILPKASLRIWRGTHREWDAFEP